MGIFNATATYGKGFEPTGETNEYKIKIYTGGFAGKNSALKKLEAKAKQFISSNQYEEYKIISSKFEYIPSGFKFIVRFK